MDVAVVKNEYADATSTGKTGKVGTATAAEKLIGDFSAAVVARLSKAGSTAASKGKSALVENLNPKFEAPREAPPQRATRVQRKEPHQENRPSSRARDPYRDNAPQRRDDAPVRERERPADPRKDDASTAPPAQSRDQTTAPKTQDNTDTKTASKTITKDTTKTTADTSQQAAMVASIAVPVTLTPTQVKSDGLKDATGKSTATPTKNEDATPQKNILSGVNPDQKGLGKQKVTDGKAQAKDEVTPELFAKNEGGDKKTSSKKAQSAAPLKDAPAPTKTQNATLVQQQAADLARKIGPDQNINVNVSVAKKADKLASQPSSNLAGPTLLNDTTDKAAQTTAKATTKGPTVQNTPTTNLGQQNGQQGAQAQNQSQAQAALAAAANFADGRNAQGTQKAPGASASQAIKSGGTEATSNANVSAATTENPAQAQRTAAPLKAPPPPRAPPQQRVSEQVTVQIAKGLNDGLDTIRIQLKPAHLGLVDVQLEMTKDGRVSVVISADNKNTLDMLKQDSRQLQVALRDAGLQMGAGDLSFSMRGQGGQNGQGNAPWQTENAQGRSPERRSAPLREPTLDELLQTGPSSNGIISKDRVDITA